MVKTIFNSFAALIGEILFSPLEDKIHIFAPPCNILYIFNIIFKSQTICLEEFLDYLSLVVDKQFEGKGNLCTIEEEKKQVINGPV